MYRMIKSSRLKWDKIKVSCYYLNENKQCASNYLDNKKIISLYCSTMLKTYQCVPVMMYLSLGLKKQKIFLIL